MKRLMIDPERQIKGIKKTAQKAQHKAFESLCLLMVHDYNLFKKHLEMLIGYITNDQHVKKKSSMIYAAIKCLFDCIMVNSFMLETCEEFAEKRGELRKLLMR